MQTEKIKHMKKQLIPIASVAGLALTGLSAHAQINYHDGDLIVALTQSSATADVEIDLGSLLFTGVVRRLPGVVGQHQFRLNRSGCQP